MATFLANKINSIGGDITGRTAHVQIMFPLKLAKYEIQKPSICRATLFRSKAWSMFRVFQLA